MVKFDKKEVITFDYINVLDFGLIEFILIETEETLKDKYVGQIKKDFKNYLYNHLYIFALSMILKYSMVKIDIS